jgi:hypothetical protein
MFSTKIRAAAIVSCVIPIFTSAGLVQAQTVKGNKPKIYAQKLLEGTLAAHPEVTGLELASTPPKQTQCLTIAATEAKEIGEKCDKDEFTAMKTNKPFIEKEKEHGEEVYDVTMPLHDATGKVIGTVGMDFKSAPGQQEAQIRENAERIAKELEAAIPSKQKLFEPAA